jgi:hypothetical protein
MPPVAAAAAAAATFLASGTLAATIAISVITMAVTTLVSTLLRPKVPQLESQNRKVTVKSGIEPCRVIYGEYFGSGALVFAGTSGGDNKWLHLVLVHTCHEVQSIDEVWFNDKPSTHPDFSNVQAQVVRFEITGGEDDLLSNGTGDVEITIDNLLFSYEYDIGSSAKSIRDVLFAQMENMPGYEIYPYADWMPYLGPEIQNNGYIYGISVKKIIGNDINNWDFTYDFTKTGTDTNITIRDLKTAGHASDHAWFRINNHLGTDNQQADPDLVHDMGNWTDAMRLRGCAYTYIRLEYDEDIWTGVPQINFLIKGKQDIYDPRDKTTGYSVNWALCIRDYLSYEYGFNVNKNRLPNNEWIAAANICDEKFNGNPKYVLNGGFTLDLQPIDILEKMKSAAQGQVVYTRGVWVAKPAAYDSPIKTITLDDLIEEITITPAQSKFDRANIIKGSYIEPDVLYSNTEYPEVKDNDLIDQYGKTYDTIDLPFTIDAHIAQMLAGIRLKQMKYSRSTSLKLNMGAIDIKAWDVIKLDIPELWKEKQIYRVVSTSISMQGVLLMCQEDNADIYVPVNTQDVNFPGQTRVNNTQGNVFNSDKYLVPKNSNDTGGDNVGLYENTMAKQ